MRSSVVNVIPGLSIGDFKLSMTIKELLQLMNQLKMTFKVSTMGIGQIIKTENYSFWIVDEKITQISVSNNVCAKIRGICGLGATLGTCEQKLNTKFNYDDYITTSSEIKGLGLDIEDYPENIETAEEIDKFDDRSLKVLTIYIFHIDEKNDT